MMISRELPACRSFCGQATVDENSSKADGSRAANKFQATGPQLAPVWRAHAAPGVAHLLVVRDRIVDLDPESEDLRRQRASRCQYGVGRHHPVALRGNERHPRVDEVLLRVEHIERS